MDQADQRIDATDVLGTDSNGDPLISAQIKNLKDMKFGLGVDFGLKSNCAFLKFLPGFDFLKPQIGLTWQDIGNPSFQEAEGNPQTINAGIAIHPDFWILKNAVALDFREVNVDKDFISKVHFGIESVLDLPVNVGLRAGLSQGYITGGASVDLWAMKIDAAIYYEEVGIKAQRDGSLRFAGTVSFNI